MWVFPDLLGFNKEAKTKIYISVNFIGQIWAYKMNQIVSLFKIYTDIHLQ